MDASCEIDHEGYEQSAVENDGRPGMKTWENVSTERDIRSAQRLRIKRFSMAVATYTMVILATTISTRLGLGSMGFFQWTLFIGLALLGNMVFLIMFFTGANLRFSDPSLTWIQIFFSTLWGMMPMYFLPAARPIILMFYLPAFSFGILQLNRNQYLKLVGSVMGVYFLLLNLEYFMGRPGFLIQYELFLFILFGILLTWFAFFGGYVSHMRKRLRMKNEGIKEAHKELTIEMEERRKAQEEKDNLIVELRKALGEVKTLSGMLPICSSCKKIRDDKGYWNKIESYIRSHSEVQFSHGICPDCAKKLYPDIVAEKENKKS
jgi:hypothetical protein